MEKYKYIYCGIEGYLINADASNGAKPVAMVDNVGFYAEDDVKNIFGEVLLTYDDFMGGNYCGGEIMIAIVDDLVYGGKTQQWVSVQYYKSEIENERCCKCEIN